MNTQLSSKIVIIGGTGLIGTKVGKILTARGYQVIAASPSRGINALTGEGLDAALAGARIVIDVSNSPSFENDPVMEFFTTSGKNLAAAEKAAGVQHHIALSVVGTDRLQTNGYFRAKLVQENLIKESGIPYTIIRATQFHEFVDSIAYAATVDGRVRLSPSLFQPIAADDVASAVAEAAVADPLNGIRDIAGPEKLSLSGLVRKHLAETGDTREVIDDPSAGYFGAPIDDQSLTAGPDAWLGSVRFDEWFRQSVATK
ncbi:SDR family oxidoreductase [Luteolibacter luteus]|uniref:SDR family oxidoreductase n=1 Tax=Luteolibacter luteus TaxID=2728835 RepID=A0A858RRB1_9BACT|nr:SDR family oxidoreductase [Luteolibacter luteus]QJE98670.1 SDR family oxidoreductase [Luteolibacter luteus]